MKMANVFSDIKNARYNAAAWHDPLTDNIILLSRDVDKAGAVGEPDIGRLVQSEIDKDGKVIQEKAIWEPKDETGYLLEDPRALRLNDGKLVIGLTAVLKDEDRVIPYPAIMTKDEATFLNALPEFKVINDFGPGKNITPIDKDIFMFRPEDPDYFHKLLIFKYDGVDAEKIQDLEFPTDLDWALWRIGTTMSPIWIDENKALMLFHGISIVNDKYVYSMGRGLLQRDNGVYSIKVLPEKILSPDDFLDENGSPIISELHAERRVIYSCGGLVKKDNPEKLNLFVNVGDMAVYDVEFEMKDLLVNLV